MRCIICMTGHGHRTAVSVQSVNSPICWENERLCACVLARNRQSTSAARTHYHDILRAYTAQVNGRNVIGAQLWPSTHSAIAAISSRTLTCVVHCSESAQPLRASSIETTQLENSYFSNIVRSAVRDTHTRNYSLVWDVWPRARHAITCSPVLRHSYATSGRSVLRLHACVCNRSSRRERVISINKTTCTHMAGHSPPVPQRLFTLRNCARARDAMVRCSEHARVTAFKRMRICTPPTNPLPSGSADYPMRLACRINMSARSAPVDARA